MRRGRPLYFLATVGLVWTGARMVMLWPAGAALPPPLREIVPVLPAAAAVDPTPAPQGDGASHVAGWGPTWSSSAGTGWRQRPTVGTLQRPEFIAEASALAPGADFVLSPGTYAGPREPAAVVSTPSTGEGAGAQTVLTPRSSAPDKAATGSRWSMTSWLIARSGTGLGASPDSPQLGGTQGGVRVDYDFYRGLSATARVAAPAAGAGREASLGVAWRPAGVPLRFVAEQRFALDAGRGGPSVGVSGGVSDVPIAAGFGFESYAQAGLIWRDGTEHYADGIARATRVVAQPGKLRLDLGMGAWGGVQRGVQRLDVGPTLGARLPVSGGAVRVSLDWRQRVAGNARPGSGPAISAGADF